MPCKLQEKIAPFDWALRLASFFTLFQKKYAVWPNLLEIGLCKGPVDHTVQFFSLICENSLICEEYSSIM